MRRTWNRSRVAILLCLILLLLHLLSRYRTKEKPVSNSYTFIPALASRSVVRHSADTVTFTSFPLDGDDVLQVFTNASGD